VDLPWLSVRTLAWQLIDAVNGLSALHHVKRTGPRNQMTPAQPKYIWQAAAAQLAAKVAAAGEPSLGAGSAGELATLANRLSASRRPDGPGLFERPPSPNQQLTWGKSRLQRRW
jgi:hypothetical protein